MLSQASISDSKNAKELKRRCVPNPNVLFARYFTDRGSGDGSDAGDDGEDESGQLHFCDAEKRLRNGIAIAELESELCVLKL
ncbi:hypothetical protein AAE478_003229 [Parahypoxylon ruwenzoriense]